MRPTSRQLGVWRIQQRLGRRHSLNISTIFRLTGPLDVDAMGRAVTLVAHRQQMLTVVCDGHQPALRYGDPVPLEYVEAQQPGEGGITRIYEDEARHPFDVANGEPLFRPVLVRLGHDEHALVLVLHLLICDRRSLAVLLEDIAAAYAAELGAVDLQPLDAQYPDVAGAAEAAYEEAWAYWHEELTLLPELPLGPHGGTAIAYDDFHTRSSEWSTDLASSLRQHCVSARVTPFIATATAVLASLHRRLGRSDLRLATMFENRFTDTERALVGPFSYAMVLRVRVEPDATYAALEARVRRTLMAAIAHRAPLEGLLERLELQGMSSEHVAPVWLDVMEPPPPALPRLGEATVDRFAEIGDEHESPEESLNVVLDQGEQAVRVTALANAAVLEDHELTELATQVAQDLAHTVDHGTSRVIQRGGVGDAAG